MAIFLPAQPRHFILNGLFPTRHCGHWPHCRCCSFSFRLIMMNRDARLSKYQTQLVQSMFFWMIFSVVQILLSKDFRPQSFITLIPSLSFFITHFLLLIRRRKFAEMHIWLLIIGIVTMSYSARYNLWNRIAYDSLLVPDSKTSFEGKRVLTLDARLQFLQE